MLIFSGQLSLLPAYHFTECVPDGERSRSVVESLFLWFACNSAFAYVIDLNYPFRILFNIDSGFEARTLSFGMQRSTRDQHAGHSVTGCFRSSASRAFSLSRFNNSACSLPASFTGFYPNVDARPSHVSRSATKSALLLPSSSPSCHVFDLTCVSSRVRSRSLTSRMSEVICSD